MNADASKFSLSHASGIIVANVLNLNFSRIRDLMANSIEINLGSWVVKVPLWQRFLTAPIDVSLDDMAYIIPVGTHILRIGGKIKSVCDQRLLLVRSNIGGIHITWYVLESKLFHFQGTQFQQTTSLFELPNDAAFEQKITVLKPGYVGHFKIKFWTAVEDWALKSHARRQERNDALRSLIRESRTLRGAGVQSWSIEWKKLTNEVIAPTDFFVGQEYNPNDMLRLVRQGFAFQLRIPYRDHLGETPEKLNLVGHYWRAVGLVPV